jgi:hypothetical protein
MPRRRRRSRDCRRGEPRLERSEVLEVLVNDDGEPWMPMLERPAGDRNDRTNAPVLQRLANDRVADDAGRPEHKRLHVFVVRGP